MRSTAGEANARARLTEEAVRAIRRSSLSNAKLAKVYGVSTRTVSFARLGQTWAHIPGAVRRQEGFGALPGEAHHNAKLTDDAVLALRAGTLSPAALRKTYGVSDLAIQKARKGITWKHLNAPAHSDDAPGALLEGN